MTNKLIKPLIKPINELPKKVSKPILKPIKAIPNKLKKQLSKLTKQMKKIIEPVMNAIKNIIKTMKCAIKLVMNIPKCFIFYFLDMIKYTLMYLPILILMSMVGLSKEWIPLQATLDNLISWPNSTQNQCYRCKDKEMKGKGFFERLKKMMRKKQKIRKKKSFHFFFFLLVAVVGVTLIYWCWYIINEQLLNSKMNLKPSVVLKPTMLGLNPSVGIEAFGGLEKAFGGPEKSLQISSTLKK
jgi:hypothetical protein